MTEAWRQISGADRTMYADTMRSLLLERGEAGVAKYGSDFVGDPLVHLVEELLDSLFYAWVAQRERAAEDTASTDRRRRLFVDSIRHARVEMAEGMKNHPWEYGQFLTLLEGAVGQIMGARPVNTGADFPLLRALARVVAICEEWDEQDATGYPRKAQESHEDAQEGGQPDAGDTQEPEHSGKPLSRPKQWNERWVLAAGYVFTTETKVHEYTSPADYRIHPGIHESVTLHRVRYIDGTIGGWVESNRNLTGYARVLDEATVFGDAVVSANAVVSGKAQVYGHARVEGNAQVRHDAKVGGHARIADQACISGEARVFDDAVICDQAKVEDMAWVHGEAVICGQVEVAGTADVAGNSVIGGKTVIAGNME